MSTFVKNMNKYRNATIDAIAASIVVGLIVHVVGRIQEERLQQAVFWLASVFVIGFLFLPRLGRGVSVILERHYKYKNQLQELSRSQNTGKHADLPRNLYGAQHMMIHEARDAAIQSMPIVPKYSDLIPDTRHAQLPFLEEQFGHVVDTMLSQLWLVFKEELPAGAKVWTCLRTRRSKGEYTTWKRQGGYTPNRKRRTQPMHKDRSRIISALRIHFEDTDTCVMITGQTDSRWPKDRKNNRYKEDNSVLMGSVMTRSWDSSKEEMVNNCQAWILCVNSNLVDCFDDYHVSMLQAYVDVFSWLANQSLRFAAEKLEVEQNSVGND